MEESIVRVSNLSHKYSKAWAIRDISFEVKPNSILGLLGSNGAGKSTTMNILCGVLNQTEGDVFINNINLRKQPVAAKQMIGFLPQTAPLHLDLTVDEYLTHCAWLRLMDKKQIPEAIKEAKEKCGITHFSNRLIRNLSGGYKQRVGIAQAIIHKPALVVLDEPTNGLDPTQILEVRKLIKDIAKERAVIFSSHILSEVQATCHEIRMIEQGQMVFAGTMEEFDNYILPNSMVITLANAPELDAFKNIQNVTKAEAITSQKIRLYFENDAEISERVIEHSVKHSWRLQELQLERSSLDEIFAQLSQKAKQLS